MLRGTGEFLKAPVVKNERTVKQNLATVPPNVRLLAKPNELCAMRVNPAQLGTDAEWILGKVISYNPETGLFVVSDEDPDSIEKKKFTLPESQVKTVGYSLEKVSKGDTVFAVYPETTSFYQATVYQPPRKISGSVAAVPSNLFIYVQFKDDSDEFGITHEKMVMLNHVTKINSKN